MIRNKFWEGLIDERLKNASHHKYDTVKLFWGVKIYNTILFIGELF